MKAWAAIVGACLAVGGMVYASGATNGENKLEAKQHEIELAKHDERLKKIEEGKADKADVNRIEVKIDKLDTKIDTLIDRELDRKNKGSGR